MLISGMLTTGVNRILLSGKEDKCPGEPRCSLRTVNASFIATINESDARIFTYSLFLKNESIKLQEVIGTHNNPDQSFKKFDALTTSQADSPF